MIYQVIEQILESGGVVGLASPRIDVCLELHQRLSRDFPVRFHSYIMMATAISELH